MTDRAIQSDVQNDTDNNTDNQTDQQVEKLHPREAAMRNIMKSRLATFSEESGIQVTPSVKAEGDPDADPDDAVAEAERNRLQIEAQNDDEPAKKAEPVDIVKAKVKVKIDGEEREVTVEEMQREFQKGRTADKRLDEVNRRQRELEEREAQLAAQLEASKKAAPVEKKDESIVDPAVAKQFTAALFDGDEEKAVAAFNAAVQDAVTKATAGRTEGATHVDVDKITAEVEQRFAVNSALSKSKADYPELYADPDIEALAAMKIRAKRANEGMSFVDALESTQVELAEKFGWKKQGRQDKADSTTRDDKLKRKQALDPVESANVKSSTTETPPLTNSQIIAKMAQSRPGYGT